MLLKYGDIARIKDSEWYILELRSERTASPTLKRIGRMIPEIFDTDPVEVYAPVAQRDHENFDLKSDSFLFVHSDEFQKVRALRTVIGVAALFCDETTRKPIRVSDTYIREMIQVSRQEHQEMRKRIRVNDFVRILDGPSRDYCGNVIAIENDYAQVKVTLKGRFLLLSTPLGNLMTLEVPKAQQVYYYCDLVKDYVQEHGSEAQEILKDDLTLCGTYRTDHKVSLPKKPKRHRSRHETTTALVRGMIASGQQDMFFLTEKVFEAMKEEKIKRPKSPQIVYAIIKRSMVELAFPEQASNPEKVTFRDILRETGSSFSLQWVEERSSALGIQWG